MSLSYNHIKSEIKGHLSEICDPEIPVLNIQELGVLRDVDVTDGGVKVTITPTYSGCPAMEFFETEIHSKLNSLGYKQVEIDVKYAPAWTTDWMSDAAKEKLKAYGIAPPEKKCSTKMKLFQDELQEVHCPRCSGVETTLTSQFGSTACKALYYCNACQEPFEHFKCI